MNNLDGNQLFTKDALNKLRSLNDGDIVVESHFDNLTDGMKAEHILEGDEQLGR